MDKKRHVNDTLLSQVRKHPMCELPKLIIWHDIGPIWAANSRLLLFDQCRRLHRSSAGPTTAAFVDFLNLPTETWPSIGLIPSWLFLLLCHPVPKVEVRHSIGPLLYRKQVLTARVWSTIDCQVHTGVIILATGRYWQPIFGNSFADAGPVLGRI